MPIDNNSHPREDAINSCLQQVPIMNPQPPASDRTPLAEKADNRLRIESEKIFCGASTVEIEHAGQRYLLRITRENKLILTK